MTAPLKTQRSGGVALPGPPEKHPVAGTEIQFFTPGQGATVRILWQQYPKSLHLHPVILRFP